jgi:hypothetical protein
LEPLPKVLTRRQILGHHEHAAILFAHVDQTLHFFGSRAPKEPENQ